MLRRLLSILWYSSAALVVVVALGFSLARLTLPMLESRAGQLETLIKDAVGQEVQIGHLEISWRGLGPEVRVYDFAVNDQTTSQALLTARELRIDISLLRSLWVWRPVPSRLVLLGSEVNIYRDAAGRLAVQGVHLRSRKMNPWLVVFGQPHVELRDIRLHWHDALEQIPDLVLSDVDLRMRNRGDRHQVEMDLQLPAEFGSRLQLIIDLTGAADRPDDWQGKLYVAIEQAPLARWLAQRLPEGWQLDGELNGAFWLNLQASKLQHAQGKLDINALRVSNGTADESPLFAAQRVATRLDYRQVASAQTISGWTLNLDQLQVRQDDGDWPETGLTLAIAPLSDIGAEGGARTGQRMQVAVDYLRIETVLPLLARYLKVNDAQHALVQQLGIEGELRKLQLAFVHSDGQFSDFMYQTRFNELHNTAAEKFPGVSALSGKLAGNPQRGVLELDSHDAQIVFPNLFREPLQLSTLIGRVDWQHQADRLRIETSSLLAANDDISTRSRLRLDIPNDGGKPLLDLQSTFVEGRVQSTYKYLPVGIMPAHTVEWLDRALVSGRVSSGGVLYQGRLGDFPFDNATGRMEVRASVTDAVLDYKEGWHRIEGLEAELAFINRSMQIRGVAGKVLGSDLQEVDVRIDDLAHARLTINGGAAGSLADMLRFVQESPIGVGAEKALNAIQATGNAQLKLGLMIPLAEHKPAEVDGRLQLTDNGLALTEWDIALEKLTGELQFTHKSVSGQDLHGNLLGVPVKINVDDVPSGGVNFARVRTTGRLPLLDRLRKSGGSFGERFTGSSDWLTTLFIPMQSSDASARVEVQSDLQGIGIDLPQPFGKPAEETRNLVLRAELKAQALGPLKLQYAEHSAAFELETRDAGQVLSRGTLKLSGTDAQLPKTAGIQVLGSLPVFVWDEWRALLNGGAAAGNLHGLDVNLEDVAAFGRHFQQLQIKAQRGADGWEAQLEGPDVEGRLEIPSAATVPLRLRLAHLTLPPQDSEAPTSAFNPGDLPALDLEVQQLQLHDMDLGQVTLTTHPISTGIAVDALQVNADWMTVTANGEWTQQNGQDASRFRIGVQDGDLSKMLSAFGYAGSVEGGDTQGEIDANWPGTPTDFTLAELEGSLEARIGKGRLLNVEAGAGRVFGLFNLQGLRRRLSLDFSDVFEKGFSFDHIKGKFSLLDGDAYTNDLEIEGPAARIEISGRTGLAKQDYDQLVTVYPHVQSTLPIAGALAGGPVVGAALLLADKLFAQQLEDLTSFAHYQYTVTGSWDDPQFKQLPREPARPLPKDSAKDQ
ncbi:MAG: TIGR02099 family protein [Gammaproteobacteria bacterium]|nr:TIGR02099 family protein [Gammaproteobacteria bacterium]